MTYENQYRTGQYVATQMLSFTRMLERNGIDPDQHRVELTAIEQLLSRVPKDFDLDKYLLMLPALYGVKPKRDYIPNRYITYHYVCRECGESDVGTFDKFQEPKLCHLKCQSCTAQEWEDDSWGDDDYFDDDIPF